jgi:hypothetical protein
LPRLGYSCLRNIRCRSYCFQQQDGFKDRGYELVTVPAAAPLDFENTEVNSGEEMGVKFEAWLQRDPSQPFEEQEEQPWVIDMWWERNFYPSLEMVANDLHAKGILPAGEYCILIDW